MPKPPIYICVAMLLLGAAPMPYGYYVLLRIVACAVFAFAAFAAFQKERAALPWAYGLLAVLFNPIIKVHFEKEVWAVIDIAAAVFLLASAKAVYVDEQNGH